METTPLSSSPWKIFHLVSLIILMVWGVLLTIFHFIVMIVWYQNGYPGYGNNDFMFLFLDATLLALCILGIVIMFAKDLPVAPTKILWKLHVMGILIGVNMTTYIFVKQWVVEFGFATYYIETSIFSSVTSALSGKVGQSLVVPVMAFFPPGTAVVFSVVNLALGILASISVVGCHISMKKNRTQAPTGQPAIPQTNNQAQPIQTVYPQLPVGIEQKEYVPPQQPIQTMYPQEEHVEFSLQ